MDKGGGGLANVDKKNWNRLDSESIPQKIPKQLIFIASIFFKDAIISIWKIDLPLESEKKITVSGVMCTEFNTGSPGSFGDSV